MSDTANWKTYKNDWYGFQLKYSDNLPKPVQKKAAKGDKWEYNFEFRKDAADENPVIGFDVSIYSIYKTKELENTQEFPGFKFELNENETCQFITGHLTEKENFLVEEVYISPSDDCRVPAFFYTLTGDEYMYNIVPVLEDGVKKPVDMKKYAIDNFPDFFSAASSFNLVDIKKPKAHPAPRRVTAPMPVAAKEENGRLVCAKKNDKPGKSKQGKKHHLDMECCLDPDEDPNPHCYYDPEKYGKYL